MRNGRILLGACVFFLAVILTQAAVTRAEYQDNGDGTVFDTVTDRMWQKTDDDTVRNWEAALKYCSRLKLAGFKDWRLPDISELESILDISRYQPPYIDPVFECRSSYYWSSTTGKGDPASAWVVGFQNGYVETDDKVNAAHYVRCVRGGP